MQSENYDTKKPWEDFGNAIIVRACDDYVHALTTLKQPKPSDPKKEKSWIIRQQDAVLQIRNINRFFRGDWYSFLTGINPEYIIQKLIKEHGNEKIVKRVNETPFEKERI